MTPEIKFYFTFPGFPVFNIDKEFEHILLTFHGRELDLVEHLRFAPVIIKNGCWVHAINPVPATGNWPFVARHLPFKIDGLDGYHILEFVGTVMLNTGRFVTGSCVDFQEVFTKLIPPRFVHLKCVENQDKVDRIDSSFFKF